MKICFPGNAGQKVVNKFKEIKQDKFLYAMFYSCFFFFFFLQVFIGNVKIWLLGVSLRIRYQIEAFQGFSLNFLSP